MDFELISHGLDPSFSGCGLKGTRFRRVLTAVGCCQQEAYVNLLDQIGVMEYGELDFTEVENKAGELSTKLWNGIEEDEYEGECEFWFCFSIRYNLVT